VKLTALLEGQIFISASSCLSIDIFTYFGRLVQSGDVSVSSVML